MASHGRRMYRGEVALHIQFSRLTVDQAPKVVKGIVDSFKDAAYADDQAVGFLAVTIDPVVTHAARVSVCNVREYADAYDIVHAAFRDARSDYEEENCHSDPWRSNPLLLSEEGLEETRENLRWMKADPRLSREFGDMIVYDENRVAERELHDLLEPSLTPFDRPGPLSLGGRAWMNFPRYRHPGRINLHVPRGGSGSWTADVTRELTLHAETWDFIWQRVCGKRVALDIGVDSGCGAVFDLDNLAHRVVRAFRSLPAGPTIGSYRVFRHAATNGGISVRLVPTELMVQLSRLFVQPRRLSWDFRPDPEQHPRRLRPKLDEQIAQSFPEELAA